MSNRSVQPNPFDPFNTWETMRDAYLDVWGKAMIDTVNSEDYSRAMGALLDTYLTASRPFQQLLERTMTQVLTQLNMPLRSDITSLAERLTNIEVRLDDLDAKVDALHAAQASAPGDASPGEGE